MEVVESVPIHEDIKLRKGSFQSYIKNYIKTLENLASCGIKDGMLQFYASIRLDPNRFKLYDERWF